MFLWFLLLLKNEDNERMLKMIVNKFNFLGFCIEDQDDERKLKTLIIKVDFLGFLLKDEGDGDE